MPGAIEAGGGGNEETYKEDDREEAVRDCLA